MKFVLICLRNRGKFTLPDSHQVASRGGWCDGAGILCGPVERSRGVALQGVTRHIFQQLLFHCSTYWYKELQTGEVHFGKEVNTFFLVGFQWKQAGKNITTMSCHFKSPKVYEFAVKEVLIHRVPLVDGGISPQKKKRKHRHDITIDYSSNKSLFGNNLSLLSIF